MKYKILNSSNFTDLENQVNEHLSDGWKICGNLVVSVWNYAGSDFQEFYQPMTKEEKFHKNQTKKLSKNPNWRM